MLKSLLLLALLAGTVGWGQDGIVVGGGDVAWDWDHGVYVSCIGGPHNNIPEYCIYVRPIEPLPSSHRRIERIEVETEGIARPLDNLNYGMCTGSCMTLSVHPRPKIEPIDVPAIQEDVTSDKAGISVAGSDAMILYPCTDGQHYEKVDGFDDLWECRGTHVVKTKWSCVDKTRFLLKAEDGSRHCIKFGGQP